MRHEIQDRSIRLAQYIIRTGATVRQTAHAFGMSKSSVHKDMHERLRLVHPGLYAEVREILDYHQAIRHLRGGAATRRRWRLIRQRENAEKERFMVRQRPAVPPQNNGSDADQ